MGGGTYYAQVIYQAQADLAAQQAANPGSRNAMIILSDGDATATHCGWGQSSSCLQPSSTHSLNGIDGNNPTNPAYPSAVGECGQAALATQTAANAGTQVYSIGYGTETSESCETDERYSTTVTTGGGSWAAGMQACQAMAAMESAPINFYSDNAHGCLATAPDNQSITSLTSIFHQITASLSSPRLIPNGTSGNIGI